MAAPAPPPPLLRQHIRIPDIVQEIGDAISIRDLNPEQVVSKEICEQIHGGEEFYNEIEVLLTRLSEEDVDSTYIKYNNKTYNLLQYAIIMDRPNWVRQLLYFGAITLPTESNDNYPNHGWGLYLDACDDIKAVFAEPEIIEIFGGNQIDSIQNIANDIDDRVNNNP